MSGYQLVSLQSLPNTTYLEWMLIYTMPRRETLLWVVRNDYYYYLLLPTQIMKSNVDIGLLITLLQL